MCEEDKERRDAAIHTEKRREKTGEITEDSWVGEFAAAC